MRGSRRQAWLHNGEWLLECEETMFDLHSGGQRRSSRACLLHGFLF